MVPIPVPALFLYAAGTALLSASQIAWRTFCSLSNTLQRASCATWASCCPAALPPATQSTPGLGVSIHASAHRSTYTSGCKMSPEYPCSRNWYDAMVVGI